MSHDSRVTFVQASHDCTTREIFAQLSHDSREIFVQASHDSRETFAQVSHKVLANFDQFYLSQFSLEMVLFMSHICRIVQIAETSFQCVCERLRRVGNAFVTYAMTWQRFCDYFCRTKIFYMFKTLATLSRRVRDTCEDFAIPCDSLRRFGKSICKPIVNSSHPSEIGALGII